jgi:hypothetical protein
MSRKKKRSVGENRRQRPSASPSASPMAAVTRSHIAAILERARAGEELQGEEADMLRAIRQHPEYEAIFAQGAEGPGEIDGVNPWLHVSLHTVVDRQRHLIPEVDAALNRLQLRGLSEHEAQHRVAELVARQIHAMFQSDRPYDQEQYLEQLRSL